ncbi:MAG: hypothetical protein KY476_00640 [Planctomycetes bacterium]|nr:hypothetical protein [Planctomycetota bacterium]
MKRCLHVAESAADSLFVKELAEQMDHVCLMVEEIFVASPQLLLSPVMRRLMTDAAAVVLKNLRKVRWQLHVDNLGDDLTWER